MSLDEPSEASAVQTQAAPAPWYAAVVVPLLVTCLVGTGAAGLALWRSAPSQEITVAHLEKRQRDLETQITRHDTRLGEMERASLATASDVRSNREQIEALRAMVAEIRAYNASTMREIQGLAQSFSKVEGYYLNHSTPPRRSENR